MAHNVREKSVGQVPCAPDTKISHERVAHSLAVGAGVALLAVERG